MSRSKQIEDNKFKVLLSPREDRKKKEEPRMKSLVHRIIQRVRQWRLVGYITIGVSLHKIGTPIEKLIIEMFLLIIFTELASRRKNSNKDSASIQQSIKKFKKDINLD